LKVLNKQLIKEEPKKLGDIDYKTYTINAEDASADKFKAICKTYNSNKVNAESKEGENE
jgi:hypothetical protein